MAILSLEFKSQTQEDLQGLSPSGLSFSHAYLLTLFSSLVTVPPLLSQFCYHHLYSSPKVNSQISEYAMPFTIGSLCNLFSPPENLFFLFIARQTSTHPSKHTLVFNACLPQVNYHSFSVPHFLSTHTYIIIL